MNPSQLFFTVMFAVLSALWIRDARISLRERMNITKKEDEMQVLEFDRLMTVAHDLGHLQLLQTYTDLYVAHVKSARWCGRWLSLLDPFGS